MLFWHPKYPDSFANGNHRIRKVGKDLHHHLVQPSPNNSVTYLTMSLSTTCNLSLDPLRDGDFTTLRGQLLPMPDCSF